MGKKISKQSEQVLTFKLKANPWKRYTTKNLYVITSFEWDGDIIKFKCAKTRKTITKNVLSFNITNT